MKFVDINQLTTLNAHFWKKLQIQTVRDVGTY